MNDPRHRPRLVIVGSVNMDLVLRVPHQPKPGQTIRASDFAELPGGKGANQAVAAARLGAESIMIGRVGDDAFGGTLRSQLAGAGVQIDALQTTPGPSGVALISVDDDGQNAISIVAGANGRVSLDDVRAAESIIASADALLVQFELPIEVVAEAVTIAGRHEVMTIVDPAPAPPRGVALPEALYHVDVLSPNQTEAADLAGIEVDDLAGAERAARLLLQRGARCIVVKLGPDGALIVASEAPARHVPSITVEPIDTTAAGDAFTAAMAVALAEGEAIDSAVRFGCIAGALATTTLGAQPAMPMRQRVQSAMQQKTP
ncbi:ribokinase [Planctomycetales bacterium ZRK34]|nr:ribokinase [Planctomycetales bacterium ZRK34]